MKKLITLSLLALSFNVSANCESLANKAYNAMLTYQYEGIVSEDFPEVKNTQRKINGFDKMEASTKFAWLVFDECGEVK